MNVKMVDCVISGLPWALFSKELQVSLLNQMMLVFMGRTLGGC
jgi:phospholipid N-methyltransferase